MRWLIVILVVVFAGLQYRLWYGEGGLGEQARFQGQVEDQRQRNAQLQQRNAALAADVEELKTGMAGVEERARRDLGMIKNNETFYMILDGDHSEGSQSNTATENSR
ncbi:MAG: cell division protein FtsB [Porticoccaceae bacterium]